MIKKFEDLCQFCTRYQYKRTELSIPIPIQNYRSLLPKTIGHR